MIELKAENNKQLAIKHDSGILEINGNSNMIKIQRKSGIIKINGNETCIYLDGELDHKTEKHINANDLLYQIVEVVELLIILLIFYVIFNDINY